MKRIIQATAAAATLLLPVLTATNSGAQTHDGDAPSEAVAEAAPTYTVTFRNITEGQYFTPPNFAAHERDVEVFHRSRVASPGVQAVAENGGVPVLAAELDAALDQTGLGLSGVGADAPIGPGEEVSFEFSTNFSRFSVVSMLICTNDGFGGLDTWQLPGRDGQTKTTRLTAYDAGTEINTERNADIVPAPFCDGDGAGTGESNPELAENGVIRPHRGIQGVGDLGEQFDWQGRVAEISVTRNDPAPTYTVTFENITDGQYFTPPNVAIHDRNADVFSRGRAASPGVQAVAENGAVPVLAAELQAAIDDQGFGASVVGGDAPIGPGESTTFQITADGNQLSLVSMLICTNDGFAGMDGQWFNLPNEGQSRSWRIAAFDAGTEINTERNADIVPAPFCDGDGAGTGESNPELAENGVISPHRTIRGVGDLGDAFDWKGQVARITVTRN